MSFGNTELRTWLTERLSSSANLARFGGQQLLLISTKNKKQKKREGKKIVAKFRWKVQKQWHVLLGSTAPSPRREHGRRQGCYRAGPGTQEDQPQERLTGKHRCSTAHHKVSNLHMTVTGTVSAQRPFTISSDSKHHPCLTWDHTRLMGLGRNSFPKLESESSANTRVHQKLLTA